MSLSHSEALANLPFPQQGPLAVEDRGCDKLTTEEILWETSSTKVTLGLAIPSFPPGQGLPSGCWGAPGGGASTQGQEEESAPPVRQALGSVPAPAGEDTQSLLTHHSPTAPHSQLC